MGDAPVESAADMTGTKPLSFVPIGSFEGLERSAMAATEAPGAALLNKLLFALI